MSRKRRPAFGSFPREDSQFPPWNDGLAFHQFGRKPAVATPDRDIVGRVVALFRYPVKSMQGEELNAVAITPRGALGDRAYALVNLADGKVISAKNPRKWPRLLEFRAEFEEPPSLESPMPPVRITLPDGTHCSSKQADIDFVLSHSLDHTVALRRPVLEKPVLEIYWPEVQEVGGLPHQDTVTDQLMPAGTFLDEAHIHLITTATLNQLHQLVPSGRFEAKRFRPNIVIAPTQEQGFVENAWVKRTLVVGSEVRLNVFRPCPRCVMTTLPQGYLAKAPEILRTGRPAQSGQCRDSRQCVTGWPSPAWRPHSPGTIRSTGPCLAWPLSILTYDQKGTRTE